MKLFTFVSLPSLCPTFVIVCMPEGLMQFILALPRVTQQHDIGVLIGSWAKQILQETFSKDQTLAVLLMTGQKGPQ
jgi:hypothetical protein